jgi:hypothetical protein
LVLVVGLGLFVWRMLNPALATELEMPRVSAESPAPQPQASTEPPLRVLFVGNSHTYYNDMPKLIAQLAAAAHDRPFSFETVTAGAARLHDHVANGQAATKLSAGGFHALVMQEQQQRPTFSREQRETEMDSPARVLSLNAQAIGAKPVLTMVWARRDGDDHNVTDDTFEAMHARTVQGHSECAQNVGATLAPVAIAWKSALEARPDLQLWQPDGSHPTLAGSYLSACVHYRVLYGRSPAGNPFTAGLPERDAAFLQALAK